MAFTWRRRVCMNNHTIIYFWPPYKFCSLPLKQHQSPFLLGQKVLWLQWGGGPETKKKEHWNFINKYVTEITAWDERHLQLSWTTLASQTHFVGEFRSNHNTGNFSALPFSNSVCVLQRPTGNLRAWKIFRDGADGLWSISKKTWKSNQPFADEITKAVRSPQVSRGFNLT